MDKDNFIEKIFYSNPDKLFEIIERNGGNLNEIKELQLGKLLVKERFPGLITKDHEEAVEFLFWFTFFVERELRNSIFDTERIKGGNQQDIEVMIDDMSFGQKINFVEKNYSNDSNINLYIKVLRDIKNLRNDMAHSDLDKLSYGGYFLSDPKGQLKLIINFTNSSLNRELVT